MTENAKKPKNSKARIRANNKYNEKTYDHISLMVKKGTKEKIKTAADNVNESMNQYIITAVNQRLDNHE